MKMFTLRSLFALFLALALLLPVATAEGWEPDEVAIIEETLALTEMDDVDLPVDIPLEVPELDRDEVAADKSPFSDESGEAATNSGSVSIDSNNFPDATFREYVTEFDEDENGTLSKSELSNVTYINLLHYESCASLEGIEVFTNLKELDCACCEIRSLDVSKNGKLEILSCDGNGLTALNISGNTRLKELWASDNWLESIDISNCPVLKQIVGRERTDSDEDIAYWEYDDGTVLVDEDTILMAGEKVLYSGPEVTAKLSAKSMTLGVKETALLKATVKPARKASRVRFKSSNTKVAKVDAKTGLITAKKTGTATVKAVYNGKTLASCKVTVKKAPKKVSLNISKKTLKVGGTYQLKAKLPSGTASAIKWTSSDKKVATVDMNGLVTAKKKGTVKITARTFNGKKATCKVTVQSNSSSGIELSGYYGTDIHEAAKKIGGMRHKVQEPKEGITDIYTKTGVQLMGMKTVSIIRMEGKSEYMLMGIKVGMSRKTIREKMKAHQTIEDDDTYGADYILQEDNDGFPELFLSIEYNSKGYAKEVLMCLE